MKRLQFLFVYLKILIQLIYRFLTKGISSLSVARIIALSFLFAIFFGSILLYLVELHNPTKPLSYTDALYMSTSAFCVTGLAVVPLSSFTLSGQICILLFIKLGGLGIIIFTVLAGMLLIKGISRNTKLNSFLTEFLDDNKNTKSPEVSKYGGSGVFRAIISIFQVSIIIELIGALFLYFSLPDSQDIEKYNRFFLSLFTSISAFNNAGFSLTDNLNFLRSESFPLFVVSVLIILGGIGFPVVILIEKIFLETMKNLMYKLEAYFENSMMRRALSGKDPKFFHVWVIRLSYYFEERF
ncbi:MAG: potassium transporter Trk, partial [Leptospiraceae bacterium]|nr:potassium transporter Trk [Leptospiraceae bacterium]